MCGAEARIQYLTHARHALYYWTTIPTHLGHIWWSICFKYLPNCSIGLFTFYYWVLRFLHSEYKTFIRYRKHKYFLLACDLSFHSLFWVLGIELRGTLLLSYTPSPHIASASWVAGIAGMYHCAWIFIVLSFSTRSSFILFKSYHFFFLSWIVHLVSKKSSSELQLERFTAFF